MAKVDAVTATDAALAAFPVLQRLADLRDAGWSFLPVTDDGGEMAELRGVHAWLSGYADALRVAYTIDAAGMRVDHTGGVVWQCEGGLAEVVDGLFALPAPGTRHAPRLGRGRSLSGLWLP
jgi:hypothetical protein